MNIARQDSALPVVGFMNTLPPFPAAPMQWLRAPEDVTGVSDAERSLLRRSVRDFLSNIWPADKAVENSGDAQAVAKLWPAMARQGLSSLGSDAAEAGLREIVLVFEELGRASCPAPLLGAVAANLALCDAAIERGARPARRSSPGQRDCCAGARRLRWRPGRGSCRRARRHVARKIVVCRRRSGSDAFPDLHRSRPPASPWLQAMRPA